MELYWIKYHPKSKYMLVVALGVYEGKLCCLDADALEAQDKENLRLKAAYLSGLSLPKKVAAIKEFAPSAMRHYRTISLDNITITRKYAINSSARPKS